MSVADAVMTAALKPTFMVCGGSLFHSAVDNLGASHVDRKRRLRPRTRLISSGQSDSRARNSSHALSPV